MARSYGTEKRTNSRVDYLCANFEGYLEHHENQRLHRTQKDRIFRHEEHKQTIELRIRSSSIRDAIDDDVFLESLWNTLDKWGMNNRKAKLKSKPVFKCSLQSNVDILVKFEGKRTSDIYSGIIAELWIVIDTLKLANTDAQIVTGAKALHHILPNLLPPIDVRYIGRFFSYKSFSANNQEAAFREILERFAEIAKFLDDNDFDWSGHVGRTVMATSTSKLIDNAIVGYVKKHNL